jgi:uncharacterized protein (TIGR02599 family)
MKTFPSSRPNHAGFTLTEVLVSSALIIAIMALMFTTIDQTRRTINSTTARVTQFQGARIAFEAMTRALSQATLNTYWDLDKSATTGNPLGYRRQSDLHFVSGPAFQEKLLQGSTLSGKSRTAAHLPGHAVFFQAPLGVTEEEVQVGDDKGERRYRGLSNLLSAVGFYVEWDGAEVLPEFMGTGEKYVYPRFRFRLKRVQQPSEGLMVFADYNYTMLNNSGMNARPGIGLAKATDWIKVAVGMADYPKGFKLPYGADSRSDYSRVLAENIVAILILPKVPEQDRLVKERLDDLTDDFNYDSCPKLAFDSQKREFKPNDPLLNFSAEFAAENKDNRRVFKQLHQLPPILQVTMVAIDEQSGQKLQDYSEQPYDFMAGLFKKVGSYQDFLKELGDPAGPAPDSLVYRLSNPDGTLPTPRLSYRVFTTDVVLRASKWSK